MHPIKDYAEKTIPVMSNRSNLFTGSVYMTTREVTRFLGITRRVLQEYEEKGILGTQYRPNEYRDYSDREVARILLARILSEAGFPLREVRTLFEATNFDPAEALRLARSRLTRQQTEIEAQLRRIDLLALSYETGRSIAPEQLPACYPRQEDLLQRLKNYDVPSKPAEKSADPLLTCTLRAGVYMRYINDKEAQS